MKHKKQSRRFNRDDLEEQRSKSENGRLQRTMSKTIFSQRYRDYVMSNPEGLLRMPYLIRELKATKRILKALKKRLHKPECKALYDKINMLDGAAHPSSPLCAIARHLMARSMHLDLDSLFFDDCIGEWTMETVVHGVVQYMDQQEAMMADARASFRTIQRAMEAAGAGYVEVGAFEPDRRSFEDYHDRAALQRMCAELHWDFPETGGFVVSSHRLVRVQSNTLYQSLLDAEFPGYRRTHRQELDRNKTIQENLDDILAYIWKLEELVTGADGDVDINEGDCRRCIRVAALGTTTEGFAGRQREDALCDFALYMDDRGLDLFKINHVNTYARAWYNEDERKMFQSQGIELMDAPGVSSCVLHGHCNDAPRRSLFQETPAYKRMTTHQKARLVFAQHEMKTLNTTREIGPLIPTGGKLEFEDGTEGYAIPSIKYGARSDLRERKNEQNERELRRRKVDARRRRQKLSGVSKKPAIRRGDCDA